MGGVITDLLEKMTGNVEILATSRTSSLTKCLERTWAKYFDVS
jgi:hypothetical protein